MARSRIFTRKDVENFIYKEYPGGGDGVRFSRESFYNQNADSIEVIMLITSLELEFKVEIDTKPLIQRAFSLEYLTPRDLIDSVLAYNPAA
ncbi:MAG: hypothetical protein AABX03_01060 [Nanoarchaeota archaeon]